MSIFRRFRNIGPRIRPELDDAELGRVRRQLEARQAAGVNEIQIDQVEHVIQDAAADWDRRAHRFAVLAEAAAHTNLARSWRLRQPRSADALILEAWVELVRGRQAGQLEDVRAVADHCYRAADARPADPTPWVVLLAVARLLQAREPDTWQIWNEVVVRDPWHREAHLQMLRYLSPQECGSRSRQADFADTARATVPPMSPAAGVGLTAIVDQYERIVAQGGLDALMARYHWTKPRVSSALDRAVADWCRPGRLQHAAALADLNLLAYVLVQAGRLTDAAQAFGLIGETVTPWPWELAGDPLATFEYWQARALG